MKRHHIFGIFSGLLALVACAPPEPHTTVVIFEAEEVGTERPERRPIEIEEEENTVMAKPVAFEIRTTGATPFRRNGRAFGSKWETVLASEWTEDQIAELYRTRNAGVLHVVTIFDDGTRDTGGASIAQNDPEIKRLHGDLEQAQADVRALLEALGAEDVPRALDMITELRATRSNYAHVHEVLAEGPDPAREIDPRVLAPDEMLAEATVPAGIESERIPGLDPAPPEGRRGRGRRR